MIDCERIKALGGWILVKPELPKRKTEVGLYLPEGNLLERLGHVVARVVSAGKGYYEMRGQREVFVPCEVSTGDRVVFRGHLKNANKWGNGYCFLHAKDLIGVLEEGAELNLALPYDN